MAVVVIVEGDDEAMGHSVALHLLVFVESVGDFTCRRKRWSKESHGIDDPISLIVRGNEERTRRRGQEGEIGRRVAFGRLR